MGDQGVRLVRAWLLTAVIDGLFASVSSYIYGSNPARVFRGVAATVLGPGAFQGGTPALTLGLAMHAGVALGWSVVFLVMYRSSAALRRAVSTWPGIIAVAAVFGPLVWIVMSMAVIPLLTQAPPRFSQRWWIQLAGHVPFVGLPLVASIAQRTRP